MTVKELIVLLEMMPGDAKVFMGYDGNTVVTEPASVELAGETEDQIPDCWWSVHPGDVIIICNE
jgi:hypothetical protein